MNDFAVGATLPEQRFTISLADEVRYCGAGLDFVGVHWNLQVAQSVGLPHVVAHGPFVVAKALSVIELAANDPDSVLEYSARFLSRTFTPDDGRGASFAVDGVVEEVLGDDRVVVVLTVTSDDGPVLVRVRVVVRTG